MERESRGSSAHTKLPAADVCQEAAPALQLHLSRVLGLFISAHFSPWLQTRCLDLCG